MITLPLPIISKRQDMDIKFDKRQAVELLEDALTVRLCEYKYGQIVGLAYAFHMCELFSQDEAEYYVKLASENRVQFPA